MLLVALLLFGVFSAGYLGIKAFNENLLYFYTPTDVANGKAPIGKSFRVGGLVEKDSVQSLPSCLVFEHYLFQPVRQL